MDILLMFIIAPVVFFTIQALYKKTKISPPIFYLLLGILFGGSAGIYHLFGNVEIFPNMASYNTIALWLLFFGAGFSIDIENLKKSGKVTTQLFLLPVHIEAVLMTIMVYLGLKFIPSLGFELSIFQVGIVMIAFAVSAPANVIPISMSHNAEGYSGKNRITDNMIVAAVIDNFTIFPILLITLLLSVAPSMGYEFTALQTVLVVLAMILGLVVVTLFGIFIGFIVTKILDPIGKNIAENPDNKLLPIAYVVLSFAVLAVIVSYSGPLKILGVLISVAAGVGVKRFEKNGVAAKIGFNASVLFAILGMPIIFIYVGSLVDIKTLMNPTMLLFGVLTSALALTIKGLVARYILRDEKYTEGERKYAMVCFIPKGVALVTFSLIFMGPFSGIGLGYIIEFMIMLAAIGIVITVPLGVTLMNNAKGKWLTKEDVSNVEILAKENA